MSQQIFRKSRIIINELTEPSRLISRKKSQRQSEHMSHSHAPDIPGSAESRDMGGHESRKI